METLARIIVVDDEPVIGQVLKTELEPAGFEVLSVQSGQSALELVEEQQFDAALVDINMPQMNGFSLLENLLKRQPKMIVYMITANGSIDSAVKSMKMGASDYITKPFDFDQLIDKLLQIFSNKKKYAGKLHRSSHNDHPMFRGNSVDIQQIYENADKVKNRRSTLLISGESGTGKGVLARYIHYTSDRKDLPFIHVDCASIPESLIESELFGHEKGAFTGASATHKGKFEQAGNGTIFLDEINSLSKNLQAKLLVVLQEKTFYRVGGTSLIAAGARVIAATNADLEDLVERGLFRSDLYYRLNIVQFRLPPLRQRKGDIAALAENYIERLVKENDFEEIRFSDEAMDCLEQYDWPGNIRELENAVESAAILCDSNVIELKDLPLRVQEFAKKQEQDGSAQEYSLHTQEMLTIIAALEKCGGHRENTAKMLGISRRALQYKIKKFGLQDS